MKIERMFAFGDGVFIPAVNDYGNDIAFVAYGKDETRRILNEHATENADTVPALLQDLESPAADSVPETATQPTMQWVGSFVDLLSSIVLAARSGDHDVTTVSMLDDAKAKIFFTFVATQPKHLPDAVIGYADENGEHRVSVSFSREQLNDALGAMPWLNDAQRASVWQKVSDAGTLPHFTSRKPLLIAGKLAMVFNSCYALASANKEEAERQRGGMMILQQFQYSTGVVLFLEDRQSGEQVAFHSRGKDEARRIVLTHGYDDPSLEQILGRIEKGPTIESHCGPTVRIDGDIVSYLSVLCENMSDPEDSGFLENGESDVLDLLDGLYFVALPTENESDYAALHAHQGEHVVTVAYSKRQARDAVAAMRGVKDDARDSVLGEIASCTLPEEDERAPLRIDGSFAGLLTSCAIRQNVAERTEDPANAAN